MTQRRSPPRRTVTISVSIESSQKPEEPEETGSEPATRSDDAPAGDRAASIHVAIASDAEPADLRAPAAGSRRLREQLLQPVDDRCRSASAMLSRTAMNRVACRGWRCTSSRMLVSQFVHVGRAAARDARGCSLPLDDDQSTTQTTMTPSDQRPARDAAARRRGGAGVGLRGSAVAAGGAWRHGRRLGRVLSSATTTRRIVLVVDDADQLAVLDHPHRVLGGRARPGRPPARSCRSSITGPSVRVVGPRVAHHLLAG